MRIGERTYNVKLGFTIFLAITVVSATIILYLDVDRNTWTSLKRIRPQYDLLAIILVLSQWLLNGLRFKILINSFEKKVGFWTSFNAFMGNIFMSAMTPSQSGGGPLQIYILTRAGIPVAEAFTGCLMGAVLTVVCLVISNLVVFLFKSSFRIHFGHHMGAVFVVAFIVFLFMTIIFMLSIFKIKLIKRIFGKLMLFMYRFFKIKKRFTATKKMMQGLEQYSRCMLTYAGAKRYRVFIAGLITMLCICINALIAPVLLAGLNIHQNITKVFIIQFIIFFIAYFSPTPGGSGLAEFSNYWVMASVNVEQNMLGVYTLIWRFFTSFMGVGIGALIVLLFISKRKKKTVLPN